MRDKNLPDFAAQRHKALLDQLFHQRFARAEVVVQHRGRYPRLFGDGVQRNAGDPVAGKQRQGNIHQLFAVGGAGFLPARTTGTTRCFVVFLC